MDYVVFGLGFGASLLVLGLVIRDVGPRVRYRQPGDPDGVFHAEELVARVSWERFCGALGTILAIAGLVFVIVTAICMVARTSDGTAGWVMLGAVAVLCVMIAIWTWAFFDRFGSYGILPERGDQHDIAYGAERETASTDYVDAVASPTQSRNEPGSQATLKATSLDQERAERVEGEDTPSGEQLDLPDSPPRKTPEELIADANNIDHESLDQELDIPVDAPARPRRHGLPPDGTTRGESSNSDAQNAVDATDDDDPSSTMATNRDPAT